MGEAYPMKGGDGAYSYSKNSSLQKDSADAVQPLLAAVIIDNLDAKLGSPSSNTFRIADFGCSVGPNTLTAVNNIIRAVEQKYKMEGHSSSRLPEFQVFFNDHVSNDFNTLFADLPPHTQYYGCGVPGSFHFRLFPTASLHLAYSATALHWLSKMPLELADPNSSSCNKGRIHYANAAAEVGEAYTVQFTKDMQCFLNARAQEVVAGGLMLILIPGRSAGALPRESSLGPLWQPLESSLVDMANEGLLRKAQLDSFNLPLYNPSQDELHSLIQTNGCFDIIRTDLFPSKYNRLLTAEECRSGFEEIIAKRFCNGINIDQIFSRYSSKVMAGARLNDQDDVGVSLFVTLKRKAN